MNLIKQAFARTGFELSEIGNSGKWRPRFLCDSLRSPIILSDGRVTTCTLDHNGQNHLANIHQHSFAEVIERYEATRYSAMARPISKPMCHRCYTRVTNWKQRAVPRAGWMHPDFDAEAVDRFKTAFDPSKLKMNIELSAKCNLRCIGCGVSEANFADTRGSMNIDIDHLNGWIEGGAEQIEQIRLYHMGETWNHPRWAEFCRHVKSLNPDISLFTSTNGMPLRTEAMLEEVVDVGFDHVLFSIHGATTETCQRYMGSAFDIDKALTVARRLADLRTKRGAAKPYLSWKYILFTWNDSDEEIALAKALCDEVGFDELHFTITSYPSPSQTYTQHSEAWLALRESCADLWPRAERYQATAPMAAIYPGRHQRVHWNPQLSEFQEQSNQASKAVTGFDLEAAVADGRHTDIYEALCGADAQTLENSSLVRLAEACTALGRPSEALAAYETLVERGDPSDYQLMALGRTLQTLGRHDEAVSAFDTGIAKRELLGGRMYGEDVYLHLRASLRALGDEDAADTALRLWLEQSYLREPRSRVIYAPIPKNACTFLKTALALNGPHAKAFQDGEDNAHKFMRRNEFGHRLGNLDLLNSDRFFRFAVLRNPFKRLASGFADLAVRPLRWRNIPDGPMHSLVFSHQRSLSERLDLTRAISFEAFIDAVIETEDHELDYHFRPQSTFIPAPDAFDLIADCDDLEPLLSALRKRRWTFDSVSDDNRTTYVDPPQEPCSALSARNLFEAGGAPPWWALFTPALRAKVRKRFGLDFELFESRFGTIAEDALAPLYPTGGMLALADTPQSSTRLPSSDFAATKASPARIDAPQVDAAPLLGEEAEAPNPVQTEDGFDLKCGPANLQRALDTAASLIGKGHQVRIRLSGGVYRDCYTLTVSGRTGGLVLEPKDDADVVFDGADRLLGVTPGVDGVWQGPWPHDLPLSSAPPDYGDPWLQTPELMRRREQVFFNQVCLKQVLNRGDLTPGSFCVDAESSTVWLLPPDGGAHDDGVIEASVRSTLLHLSGLPRLTLRGLRFIRDSSGFYTPQTGAFRMSNCTNVLIENCGFSHNNNKGLQIDGQRSADIVLRHLSFDDNGCVGLLASRVVGLTLEYLTFTGQNRRGGWAGHYRGSPAGAKIMKCSRVRISHCRAVRNRCTGLWLDERNIDVEVRSSVFSGNYRGLHIEATPGPALVSGCTITDNRREPTPTQWAWRFGSGLVLTHAQGVTVRDCFLSGNDTAQIGVRDDRTTRRLKDTLTGEESEEFTAGLVLEGNTLIAARGQACLRLPGSGFDGGRCWSSFEASNNLYAAAMPDDMFRVTAEEGDQHYDFHSWVSLTGQDKGSRCHG